MKCKLLLYGPIFLFFLLFTFGQKENNFPVLKGPYLGQKPPGMKPEIFAPGIISTSEYNEGLFCMYMDGEKNN